MRHIAIILAGGMGSRVGGETPKQLLPLADGRSILEHSIDAFEAAPSINEIAVVMHPEWMDEAKQLCERNNWSKVQKIIPGGNERWESSWHAILAYMDYESERLKVKGERISLWFHDAARPFVSQRILADVAEALEKQEAVTVAVPVTDTLYRIKNEKLKIKNSIELNPVVESVPSRSEYMRAQTPQAFYMEVVQSAYMKAIAEGDSLATDDAGIVRKYEPRHPIYIVMGEEANRKITYAEDLK